MNKHIPGNDIPREVFDDMFMKTPGEEEEGKEKEVHTNRLQGNLIAHTCIRNNSYLFFPSGRNMNNLRKYDDMMT